MFQLPEIFTRDVSLNVARVEYLRSVKSIVPIYCRNHVSSVR